MSITVFLKTLHEDGRMDTIIVKPNDTTETLYENWDTEFKYSFEVVRFLFEGRQLKPGRKLSDYNIKDKSTIQLALSLRGS
ncbi:ubiquitin-like [Saccostrea cucullata]|uniref:ubiquitin-like n=1 Tax=Saccostrea cuccullata TaxID=36930 RepID=UPI002ED49C31